MSIALEAKVTNLAEQVNDLALRLAAAEEWISSLRQCGFEPPIVGDLPNAIRRKPGPKPKDSNG
jgi:hypothetical protein